MAAPALLRNSERQDYRRCQFRWDLAWNRGYRPVGEPTWAIFGGAWHVAQATRYGRPGKKRASLARTEAAFLKSLGESDRNVWDEDDEKVPADDLGLAMLRNYVSAYGTDPFWHFIHNEQPFQINIPDPRYPDRILVILAGTWDGFYYDLEKRRYMLLERKTCKAFPSPKFLDLNDQAGTYLLSADLWLHSKGLMPKDQQVYGVLFDYAKKQLPDPRPRDAEGLCLNKDGVTVSKTQPAPRFWRHESYRSPEQKRSQYRRIVAEAIEMKKRRAGKLPILKSIMDVGPASCSNCPFYDVCEVHEQTGWSSDTKDILRTMYRRTDPYADHREAMEENGIELAATAA